jgi:hypothetical protein
MLPGDRLVCALVEPQTAGTQLKSWPLHVTIVPWFRLLDSSDVIAKGLTEALKTTPSFEAVADGEAMFGIRKDRPVRLIRQPTPFIQVEAKVRTYLHKKRALLIDETTKRHPEFRPHVTDQGETGLRSGDKFVCDRLYVVEQRGNYKEIVNEVRLG